MSKVVVFGASGFIGRAFVDKLISENHIPMMISPNLECFSEAKYQNYNKIEADFTKISSLNQLETIYDYDVFVYLAWSGYGKKTNDYETQIQNIKPVCDAIVYAKNLGCKRFIFASSFSEFMIRENETKSHIQGASSNVYGSVKHAARIIGHSVAKLHDIEYLSVAFANTFGPGDYSTRTPNKFIGSFLNNEDIDLTNGEHLYDWNFIDDTVNGLLLAAIKGYPDEFYYIGSRIQKPLKEIVYDIKVILKSSSRINLGRFKEDFYLDYSSIDVHKLYRHTSYLANVNFKDAVLLTAQWVRDNML